MAKKLKIYNGSSWEDVTFAITPPNTAVTNSFTTNQVIDASTSVAALRVTQRGSGEAFRVEDDTNPDSSPFVIDASGHVYAGSVNAASKIPTTRQYLNIGGTGGSGVIQLLDAGNTGTLAGLIEFHDLLNTSNSGGTRNAYIAAFIDGTTTANNRGGRLDFATKQDGVSNAAVPRMTINNAGNIGVGTTSPTDRVDVLVPAGVDSGIRFTLTSGGLPLGQMTVNSSSGEVKVGGVDAGAGNYYLGLYTLGTQRVRIDANGQVNITNSNLIINSASSVTGANWDQGMLHLTGINSATSHPGLSWHAPGASAMAIFHTRGTQCLEIRGNSNVVDTTSGRMTIRNIAISTSTPSGGLDGDMWATYV